jgi:N-acetylneuraminic acid mutarotase
MKKSLIFFLLAISLAVISSSSVHPVDALAGEWVEKASMSTERYCFGAAVVNGTIYAIGGITNIPERKSGHITTTIDANEAYDPTTDTWTEKAPMPLPHWLDDYGIAIWQNKIYCIGGPANNVYDPMTDTWEAKTPMPTSRTFLSANAVNDKIYLIGGLALGPAPDWQAKLVNEPNMRLITYSSSNLTEVYDPVTDSWDEKSPMPVAVDSYVSAVIDDRIYVISGRIGKDVVGLVQVYDTKTDSWSQAEPIPTPVEAAAAGVITMPNTKAVYVVGGNSASDGFTPTNLTQVYFPDDNSWITVAPIIATRFALSVAVASGKLYAIGGMGDQGPTATTYQYTSYNPEENTKSSTESTPSNTNNPAQETQPLTFSPETTATIGIAAATCTLTAVYLWRKKPKTQRTHEPD